MIDVAVKAGENISKSLQRRSRRSHQLAEPGLDRCRPYELRDQYNTLNDIDNFIKDAKYNNITLIDSSANQAIISNVDGGNITVTAQDLASAVYSELAERLQLHGRRGPDRHDRRAGRTPKATWVRP